MQNMEILGRVVIRFQVLMSSEIFPREKNVFLIPSEYISGLLYRYKCLWIGNFIIFSVFLLFAKVITVKAQFVA